MKYNDRIKCYSETYLHFVTEATASQIEGHLRRGSYRFHGGKPSKQKIASVLTTSAVFLSNKHKDGHLYFRLAEE